MLKKILQTVTCLLLVSPLSAFDLSLDGVEFGTLQRLVTETSWPSGTTLFSEPLTLNDGDVLQVLRFSGGYRYFGSYTVDASIYSTQGSIQSEVAESGFIVGPATVAVGYSFVNFSSTTFSANQNVVYYAQMDYAILRKGATTQSTYMTVPANTSGNFEVKLQTSTDLQTWTPTTTGIFNYGDNARFFRLVVE